MHFTGTVYRNPYWPTWPLLEITQGCTHNKCKFCTMYKEVPFRMSPLEWIEEDLKELSEKEMLEELKLFVENLTVDCSFITHHTISGINLSGPDFLSRKDKIVAALEHQISHGDLDRMAAFRRNKRTL